MRLDNIIEQLEYWQCVYNGSETIETKLKALELVHQIGLRIAQNAYTEYENSKLRKDI